VADADDVRRTVSNRYACDDHDTNHREMSTRLPAITAGELRRALQRAGWVEDRQRGSHVRLERGSQKITIADHGAKVTIPRGTLSATLKQAGMTVDDLRRLL
jgi:predicted RNA binding protein YcfA (HicA-like mRNA interferase family)